MKGGVTSGVLYPSAVRQIAEQFYLVGIGGTSAGAIAAVVAAAAEYRRRHSGSFEGFEMLEQVAWELAQPGKLLSLFRPDRSTRKLFDLLLRLLEGKAGLLLKLELARKLLFQRERICRTVVDNGFGLCSGMAIDNQRPGEPALSEWLADLVDRVADKQDGKPLTFADLHNAPVPAGVATAFQGLEDRAIDLRAVTTCLTFGRPFELPFDNRTFAFDPDEWRRLFPPRIVDHMVHVAESMEPGSLHRDGKLPLPGAELPVVVAARMSLSFPGLFSAVPLWAVNYHRDEEPMMRLWFSDGGITSNFPIHRFDALYPRWPTLGINLQYTDEDDLPQRRRLQRQGEYIYLPQSHRDGVLDLWTLFDAKASWTKDLFGFAGSIFRSAQVWHDNAFLRLPGYRDRVVEIWLTPEEGGLNLDMPRATIEALIARGGEAGRRIAHRFASPADGEPMSWDGHRWARLRSGMAGLMDALHNLRQAVASPMAPDQPITALLADRDAPPCYKFGTDKQRAAAEQAFTALLDLARDCDQMAVCKGSDEAPERPFCKGPRPRVEIGSRAPI
jgi:predicted acylesterase/phospholipase RssA